MLNITKTSEPNFFTHIKRKESPSNWEEYYKLEIEFGIKTDLKEYMLLKEQNFKCPYCERSIDETSDGHIEHIQPKAVFSHLFQEYNNLIISCMSNTSCGHYKDEKGKTKHPNYYNKFINPVLENPEDYFIYDIKTGGIIPKDEMGTKRERAELTIDVLNLNEGSLKDARKSYIISMSYLTGQVDALDYYEEFPSLVDYFKREYCGI